jgi:hypothetical protein
MSEFRMHYTRNDGSSQYLIFSPAFDIFKMLKEVERFKTIVLNARLEFKHPELGWTEMETDNLDEDESGEACLRQG